MGICSAGSTEPLRTLNGICRERYSSGVTAHLKRSFLLGDLHVLLRAYVLMKCSIVGHMPAHVLSTGECKTASVGLRMRRAVPHASQRGHIGRGPDSSVALYPTVCLSRLRLGVAVGTYAPRRRRGSFTVTSSGCLVPNGCSIPLPFPFSCGESALRSSRR